MRIYKISKFVFGVFMSAFALNCAFADTRDIHISNAYVFSSLPDSTSTAAFLTIKNNSNKPIELVSVDNKIGAVTEIHAFTEENGARKMIKSQSLKIPAKSEIKLEPGKDHIMLMELKKPLQAPQTIDLVLKFSDESVITIENITIKERPNKDSNKKDTHKSHK